MAFKNFYLDTTSLDSQVDIYPGVDFVEDFYRDNRQSQTLTGQFNQYNFKSPNRKYSFTVSFISSSDRSTINNWWENDTDLVFGYNDGVSDQQRFVKIRNRIKPIDVLSDFQDNLYSGILQLSTSYYGNETFELADESLNSLTDENSNTLLGY